MKEFFKSLIAGVIVASVFFLSIELTQRIRWYFKGDRNIFWLKYGFVNRPSNFDDLLEKIATKKMSKQLKYTNVNNINIFTKIFPNGMKKHNPDFLANKGLVNSLGFRSYEFSPKKDPKIYRIIAMGASSTAGYESDINHTYPAFLQKKLNNGEKKFEVINAGMGSQAMLYVNSLLKNELINYSPDMVMLYLTFNHLYLRRGCVNIAKDFNYWLYIARNWLSSKSLAFLTVRGRLSAIFHHKGVTSADMDTPCNSKNIAEGFLNTPEAFESYSTELEIFVKTCKDNGITAVLMTEACVCSGNSYLLLSKDMKSVFDKMYSIMKSIAIKNNVIFIDTAREMDNISNKKLMYDGLHLTPEGNEVLADIIYKNLKDKISR